MSPSHIRGTRRLSTNNFRACSTAPTTQIPRDARELPRFVLALSGDASAELKSYRNEGRDLLEDKNSVPARGASITGIIPVTGAALIVCCSSLAILIGNIGFQGDDWWQFSWPYWHSFPNSIWEYAKASRRPIEGLYTVLSFEIFGLNRVLFTLSALLLSAGSCLLMGACLNRAFPGRKTLVVLAVFFGFLLTPLSNLIYMFHTDNSRLSMLLFLDIRICFSALGRRL